MLNLSKTSQKTYRYFTFMKKNKKEPMDQLIDSFFSFLFSDQY
ncbi:hypothetical protein ANACAC_02704 [Anaerostipes caccae L1-92]|uniref:Uncharacterized protein n=1 Tax=Anaerostipes caccae (strain DSM 14662 / CCUG 47493 / JCM 13470 / NCIMB 13811 / L1-92) TaxID=411490 RepID=B0MGJ1_ANACD|nr:hypothetical protein ANACAC_02704 [Anaerostipes caccae L1-92]